VVEGVLLARCLGWCGCGTQGDIYGRIAAVCEGQALVVVSWVIHTHNLVGSSLNLTWEKNSNATLTIISWRIRMGKRQEIETVIFAWRLSKKNVAYQTGYPIF
jgi:hypothetical protein